MSDGKTLFLLSADDYALTPGVSEGIAELAQARRLSATTAIVTVPAWREMAQAVGDLREHIAVGLHVNLTLGAPLGPMPGHAPDGRLPKVSDWIRRGVPGRIDRDEVAAEIGRQIARFEAVAGAPPDLIDGHHHVHALPGVRQALAQALRDRFGAGPMPLVRVPADDVGRILRRRASAAKALFVAGLSAPSRPLFRQIGAPLNAGFSGFSAFRRDVPFAAELAAFRRAPGRFHVVMCHPGHVDAALERLDPVSFRREDELAALLAAPHLPAQIHHPARHRGPDGQIDWRALGAV
ncbi:ChbG/HpnK family deacetylase [Jiella sp. M17.18]|uniref:ChbG/HpnK family deacetylase n=1 Tax=Jiella sp. M17.18 TaxID=3234247 RepID=UPI0034DE3A05